ncbi:MAG TPA: hypothetical protein VE225_09315 [Rubrobacteraceae bacterium]|nr:hypothetical protein [Rubrobacteraceae bacterium]
MAMLYCECGHMIWSELWWEEPGHVLLFFDDLETSGTYGERVTHCPGCGQRLKSGVLKSQSDEYSYGGAQERPEAV